MGKYQPFNDLPAAQFQALVEDISRRGVLLPILVDEDDRTIDGHQRRRAAAEASVDCPRIVVEGLTEDEKEELALALNLFRRHLAGVERSKALQKLVNLGLSTRDMSGLLGVSKSTVHRDLTQVSRAGHLDRPERVKGADGKSYPSKKPERKKPPANVNPETGEIESGEAATREGSGGARNIGGQPADGPAAGNSPDSLTHDLSDLQADVEKWIAFDHHGLAIDAMTGAQRADYELFLIAVKTHADAAIDYLEKSHLKAVPS